jgi:Domain of unknown function (DUF222)
MNNSYSRRPGPQPDGATDPDPEWTEYLDDDPGWEDPGAEVPPRFWQGEAADELPPGPRLTLLTEDAVLGLEHLSDNELIGVLHATRRQLAREQYKQMLVTAEFGRRRQAAFAGALARGVPAGCRPGGFPGEELAAELAVTRAEAGRRIDDALDLTSRLPATMAGMAAGLIDAERAGWIAMYTRSLTPADAAHADAVLAEAAPDLRSEQVARKAAALEMKLNPEAVAARKEHAKRSEQRVEARREASGNASLAGRELDTADVLASKAYLDAIAAKLRASGLFDAPLDRLRALAFTDLTQGRDPLCRIKPPPAPASPAAPSSVSPPERSDRPHDLDNWSTGNPSGPAPMPALINLLVPAGTLLGWSAAPAQAGAWGLLDRDETRAVATAAAAHPQTRWCVTLTVIFSSGVSRGRDLRHRVEDSVLDAMAAALSGWFQGAGSLPDRVRVDLWSPSARASWRRSRAFSSARAWLRWRAAASLARRELSVGRWAAGMAVAVPVRWLSRSCWTWLRMSGWV